MKCDDVLHILPLLLYGELSGNDEDAVEHHLEGCSSCRAEIDRLHALHALIDRSETPVPAHLLVDCRSNLRASLEAMQEVGTARPQGFWAWAERMLAISWTPVLKPLGAIALVAIGFFGARLMPVRQAAPPVVGAIEDEINEPVASRVSFVEPGDNGGVRLIVEETRQRILSGNADDASIRRLLLNAARDAKDPGLRVESVDILASADPAAAEVRKLLLYALQHDPNPGVRLKALEGLRGSVSDPEARKTLAQVLLTDDNPGVRTQAIDLLIEGKETGVQSVLEEALRRDENAYVRLKCQRALHEINASAGLYE